MKHEEHSQTNITDREEYVFPVNEIIIEHTVTDISFFIF
jgi:hypothetical protein